MKARATTAELDAVFGVGSKGESLTERAHNSKQEFVRSQLQVTFAKPAAKGRRLRAAEALAVFGWERLRLVGIEGSAPLLKTISEPANTLCQRRKGLGLTLEQVAQGAGLSVGDIEKAETPGARSSVRVLELLAQTLALDERRLGFEPNARADTELGVRLREMSGTDVAGLTHSMVLQLAEAAWIVSRQCELRAQLGQHEVSSVALPVHDSRVRSPAWEVGYELAERTRKLLGLGDEPIASVRKIIEDSFGIPLIQESMNHRFAGATISNGNKRGIVVNEGGANRNVWVRRMTLCHELGHVLWDPKTQLQSVRVDQYAELEQNEREGKRDGVEVRANAFAIAFLVPPRAVMEMARRSNNISEIAVDAMNIFGVSATAARYHVGNVLGVDVPPDRDAALVEPDREWIAAENFTLDHFPIEDTPLSRRGKFAWYVAKLCHKNLISADSAATYLKVKPTLDFSAQLQRILELWA